MRTTVTLDEDVAAAVEHLRRTRGIGPSQAVNELARRGLAVRDDEPDRFVQSTRRLGRPRVAVDDVGGVLDAIEGPGRRE